MLLRRKKTIARRESELPSPHLPRVTRTAAELRHWIWPPAVDALARKIAKWRPQVVAFVGLSVYRRSFGLKNAAARVPSRIASAGARVFVVPNPSGLNASYPGFAHKLIWYEGLRAFLDER